MDTDLMLTLARQRQRDLLSETSARRLRRQLRAGAQPTSTGRASAGARLLARLRAARPHHTGRAVEACC